jgi:[protein-PII] uridylyltransferase
MSYAKHGTLNPEHLVEAGLMTAAGWREVSEAYDLILRTRNEMHYTERRASDLLTLRLQGFVATNLGYRHKRILRRIEAFMRDYYTATRDILQRSSEVMDRFHLQSLDDESTRKGLMSFMVRRKTAQKRADKFDRFVSKNERLYAEDDDLFIEEPARLMRTFLHTQQRHLRLSPELFILIQSSFRLVNVSYRYNTSVRETFMGLLAQKGDVARVMRQMHRVGFLGRYMPEFGALTCLVQHEFFHRYTADEHTLRTLDKLDELSGPPSPTVALYQKLFHELHQPAILYLALLLHDAGRAANAKAHDAESTVMADAVCRRLQIKGERRKMLLFLVDNHLLMYRTATTSNLDDP